ncbi:MAG: response regulator [Candidatus Hydrogenedens sp.]|nr:response regulator [Candidatus Hydrogenedens sp.]
MQSESQAGRVLVADDDRDIRYLLSVKLREKGLQVDLAVNGERALHMIDHARYDALVTDIRMPVMNGHELATRVLESGKVPTVVVITAMREPRLVSDLIARGVATVEIKPIDFDVVAGMVHAFIERAQNRPGSSAASAASTEQLENTIRNLRRQLDSVEDEFEKTVSKMEAERRRLQEEFFDTVQVFSKMLSQTGQFSGSHAARVEAMAAYVGEAAGMSSGQLRYLRLAALMHDIGQFGMPDTIITKAPHTMGTVERALFTRYPEFGAMLLQHTQGGKEVAAIIAAHRENFDGSGFPRGLSGNAIPLGARVLRLADGLDNAMMHGEGRPKERALRHLHEETGKDFDPALVPHARRFLDSNTSLERDLTQLLAPAVLRQGMLLAEHVFDDEGHFLACEGTELTDSLIHRLQAMVRNVRVRMEIAP